MIGPSAGILRLCCGGQGSQTENCTGPLALAYPRYEASLARDPGLAAQGKSLDLTRPDDDNAVIVPDRYIAREHHQPAASYRLPHAADCAQLWPARRHGP